MRKPHLVYFADPMCSWCWGFSTAVGVIQERFGDSLPMRLVLGGLRPGTESEMTAKDRAEVRSHWEHVHTASGQPFDFGFFDRPRFVYDTEPVSRAVVVLRRRGVQEGFAALKRLQAAFYAENRDVTDVGELAALASELGVERQAFLAEFTSASAQEETQADFAYAHALGVRGFPTLIAGSGRDNRYALVTSGFQKPETLVPALSRWVEDGCKIQAA